MVILHFYHAGFWNAKLNAIVVNSNHGFFNSFAFELILRYLISIFSKQMAFLLNSIWTPQPQPCSLGLCWGEVNCKDFFWNSIFNGGAGQRQTTQVMRQRPNILISSSSASAHTEWGIHTQLADRETQKGQMGLSYYFIWNKPSVEVYFWAETLFRLKYPDAAGGGIFRAGQGLGSEIVRDWRFISF